MRKLLSYRLWIVSALYIFAVILGVAVFPGGHLPTWLELLLKISVGLAFFILIAAPVLYAAAWLRGTKVYWPLAVATGIAAVGYLLLSVQLVYIKLRTCDTNAVPYDDRWHCNVSGKSVIAHFIVITLLATFIGIVTVAIDWLVRRQKAKINSK